MYIYIYIFVTHYLWLLPPFLITCFTVVYIFYFKNQQSSKTTFFPRLSKNIEREAKMSSMTFFIYSQYNLVKKVENASLHVITMANVMSCFRRAGNKQALHAYFSILSFVRKLDTMDVFTLGPSQLDGSSSSSRQDAKKLWRAKLKWLSNDGSIIDTQLRIIWCFQREVVCRDLIMDAN